MRGQERGIEALEQAHIPEGQRVVPTSVYAKPSKTAYPRAQRRRGQQCPESQKMIVLSPDL